MADKHAGGRPLKFATPKVLQKAVDDYFESLIVRDKEGKVEYTENPTVSGLAYHLDVCTVTLTNYSNRDEFFSIIKRAKQKVEIALEKRLYGTAPTGAIFNLKCNFGKRDGGEPVQPEAPESFKPSYTVRPAVSDVEVTRGVK